MVESCSFVWHRSKELLVTTLSSGGWPGDSLRKIQMSFTLLDDFSATVSNIPATREKRVGGRPDSVDSPWSTALLQRGRGRAAPERSGAVVVGGGGVFPVL